MNPIDNERASISFIRELQSQNKKETKQNDSDGMIKKTDMNQLRDLLSVVKSSMEPTKDLDRLNQIKAAINSQSYVIDFDGLAHNILAVEYEI
jgi:anti-sigma28 factor (negative regulator of flagellin synthesis)